MNDPMSISPIGDRGSLRPAARSHGALIGGTAGSAEADSPTKVTAGTVLQAIRHWWKLAFPLGLILAAIAASVVWFTFIPQYESSATLLIKEKTPFIAFQQNDDSQRFSQTQVRLMTRRAILTKALPQFSNIPDVLEDGDPVGWVQSHLQVNTNGISELFDVSIQASKPQYARTIVDAVVTAYLDFAEQYDTDETRRVIEVLEGEEKNRKERINSLQQQVRDISKRLYGNDIFDPTNKDTVVVQKTPPATQARLIDTEFELAMLRAQKTAFEESQHALDISEEELQQAVESHPNVVDLQRAIDSNHAKLHDMEITMVNAGQKERYKRLQVETAAFEEKLGELRKELRQSEWRRAMERQEAARKDKIRAMEDEIERREFAKKYLNEKLEGEVEKMEVSGGEYVELEFQRFALAQEQTVMEMISSRTLALQTELDAPGRVRLIDPASLPILPVEKAPWKTLLMATLGAFCVPFGVAVLWEAALQRVSDTSQLRGSNLTVVGEVAELPARPRGRLSSHRGRRELSLFEESIDSLRTGLRLSRSLQDMQVLAVTSAVTREGKTSLAAQLAVSIARASGEKTLLIDADMRSPDLYQVFDIPNDRGLVDVLSHECTVDDAIVTQHSDLLHVLPAGRLRASPHKLVGDGSFEKVIAQLRDRYRYIVIDTPPILSASESLVLAVAADATVLCAMRDYSRTKQVRTAYQRLEAADANPVGVVLNGVSISRYTYSYGRYVYPAN